MWCLAHRIDRNAFKVRGENSSSLIVVVLTLIIRYRKLAHVFFLFQGYLQWSYPDLQVLHERCDRHWICLVIGAGSSLLSTRDGRNEPSLSPRTTCYLPLCIFKYTFIFQFNVLNLLSPPPTPQWYIGWKAITMHGPRPFWVKAPYHCSWWSAFKHKSLQLTQWKKRMYLQLFLSPSALLNHFQRSSVTLDCVHRKQHKYFLMRIASPGW